jgi:dimethylamine/trimethylamine dehydrogenase
MPSREDPIQSQRMDRGDIGRFRQWHRQAALRARSAGFDIIYVYATHGYLVSEFLSRSLNDRIDEYGGSLANRTRLFRELLEDTKDAVGDRCAVATRFSANGHGDGHLSGEEAEEVLGALGPLPDLWDIVIDDYEEEMGSSRFVKEAAFVSRVRRARELTGRPVVSVGRFTSPDVMLRQLKSGVLDFIGAARPSIADPFLPTKIRHGRIEDIRECIGCNICYAHNFRGTALRCTQNPTMGEEWRSGWHPEHVPAGHGAVLIVGAGPSGLEAANILGKRGFTITLADAGHAPGGRVTRECRLPGLAEWARVRDYRTGQLSRMPNVSIYLGNRLAAAEVREFDADYVLIATGARWRRSGLGRSHMTPIASLAGDVLTPDDIMDGARPQGPVTVFDDDHYYMGPVLALQLARDGVQVCYVTSEGHAGAWSRYTAEQFRTQRELLEAGVEVIVNHTVDGYDGTTATLGCIYTGRRHTRDARSLVLVTSREPEDSLYRELVGPEDDEASSRIIRIGDCLQPGIIAAAVYSGHKIARELGERLHAVPRARDRVEIGR